MDTSSSDFFTAWNVMKTKRYTTHRAGELVSLYIRGRRILHMRAKTIVEDKTACALMVWIEVIFNLIIS